MSLLLRSVLVGRSNLLSPCLRNNFNPVICSRHVTMKIQKAKEEAVEDHDLKNIRIGRPQSPHLTIYAMQVTSVLSISHRISGAALSTYMIALGIGYLSTPSDINTLATMIEGLQLSPVTLSAAKFLIALPLSYHWCNGIRHLVWDTGRFLSIKGVYSTGYAMLAASAVLSAIITAL